MSFLHKQEILTNGPHSLLLHSPHVGGPGAAVHLDVEAARVAHGGPGAVPPPEAGARRVAVAAPRVGADQELAARVLRIETSRVMAE